MNTAKLLSKRQDILDKMGVWNVVDHQDGANIADSTCAFKIKLNPNWVTKKFKAPFCVCRYQQVHGVDFFETYAPVVRPMLQLFSGLQFDC